MRGEGSQCAREGWHAVHRPRVARWVGVVLEFAEIANRLLAWPQKQVQDSGPVASTSGSPVGDITVQSPCEAARRRSNLHARQHHTAYRDAGRWIAGDLYRTPCPLH